MYIKIDDSFIGDIEDLAYKYCTTCGSFIYHGIMNHLNTYKRAKERPVTKTEEMNLFYTEFSGICDVEKALEDNGIPYEREKTIDYIHCIMKTYLSDQDFNYIRKIAGNHEDAEPGYPMYYSPFTEKNEFYDSWIGNDLSKDKLPYYEISEHVSDEIDQICKIYSMDRNDFIQEATQAQITRYTRAFNTRYFAACTEETSHDYVIPTSESSPILRGLEYNRISATMVSSKNKNVCIIRTFLNEEGFQFLRETAEYYQPIEPICPEQYKDR